jgi:hypothetical protein
MLILSGSTAFPQGFPTLFIFSICPRAGIVMGPHYAQSASRYGAIIFHMLRKKRNSGDIIWGLGLTVWGLTFRHVDAHGLHAGYRNAALG